MQRTRLILLTGSLALGALILASGGTSAQESTNSPSDDLALELFARDCSGCHGVDGSGTGDGPSLFGAGEAAAHFYLTTGRMPLPSPNSEVRRRDVTYSAEELDVLIEYVGSLGEGPSIPTVDIGEGSLSDGMHLFTQNCSACHSSAGVGGALTSGIEVPSLRQATPIQVVEAMRLGPGNMPLFGPETFDEFEVNSIARYVNSLSDLEDRGGAPLGHIGPIAEGFIAWAIGLGALIIIVMFIEGARRER